jgi:hypothetical protein
MRRVVRRVSRSDFLERAKPRKAKTPAWGALTFRPEDREIP